MIGVLTHHWTTPDKVGEASTLLDRNGEAQSKAPGFISRRTLLSRSDPTKIKLPPWLSGPRTTSTIPGVPALSALWR